MNGHPSLRATTNHHATTSDPTAVRRAVLELIAQLPQWHTITRRRLNVELFGTNLRGAQSLASALGYWNNLGFIERVRRDEWRITESGREHLRLAPVMDGAS